ncbi:MULTISPECIES: RNA-directed DNA polymerase [Microbulbifer]|uniref:RNA-directed DNA polymerase n=1 Tax=Microbulbifer TaxID=48073 RepID=UPI001F4178F3|nr:RNA-directed DNA polymerase [Microbulbifer sediminum]
MTLCRDSINWAIEFISDHSDGDLFPKIVEIDAIKDKSEEFVRAVENKDLGMFTPMPCRRFIVPKDEISYRQATQLHPQDSLLLSAIVHQFGQGIEDRRASPDKIFSYRFSPTAEDGLYSNKNAWNDFWTKANLLSRSAKVVLYLDIADFYNQIYHHTVENQLIESGLPNQAIKWIISLLESTTAGVSRGVPIGPHPIHLIAEATLVPVDNSLEASGFEFIRYADDIIVFCDSIKDAKTTLATVASVLDRQQRLMLQRHKTKIIEPTEFRALCREMIEDRPIDREEARLLGIIKKYSGGNPYQGISYNAMSKTDWAQFSEKIVGKIIQDYLSEGDVDYIRLRWFYRRLAQVGHPGAIDISLQQLDSLGPCLATICFYLASIQNIEPAQWRDIGTQLLELLEADEVKHNEFFRLSILSLFSRNQYINHFSKLAKIFNVSDSFARREIMLSAYQNSAVDWLREHKESFSNMDPWQKMAFIYCTSAFPKDEKKFFINRYAYQGPFETVLAKWAKVL